MADNALVTPQVFKLPRAIDSRTQDKEQKSQRLVPVTVTKVKGEGQITVKTEMQSGSPWALPSMTIPGAYSQWGRPPIAEGDKGYAVSGDYNLSGQSQGGSVANFHYDANLTNAVFMPISSTKWPKRPNGDMTSYWINGPGGAILSDMNGTHSVQVDVKNKKIIVNIPDASWKVFLGGNGIDGTYDFVMTASGPSINVKARIG